MSTRSRIWLVVALAAIGATLTVWAQTAPTPSQAPAPSQASTPAPAAAALAPGVTIAVDKAMTAPAWAYLERQVLSTYPDMVQAYNAAHFDSRGYSIRTVPPAWGVGDGPDDIMGEIRSWPIAYALGGAESIEDAARQAWEGHLLQYTEGKVPEIEPAKNGIFRNEFITQYDWEHNSEELNVFYFYGLGRPHDPTHILRAKRLAGLYLNEDPLAQNYDPKLKIIPSLMNGSLGPRTTPMTLMDWEGLRPSQRFTSIADIDVLGDHPLNMAATMLPFNAYLLTHEAKYKNWVTEYVDAWRDRIAKNGGNIPSNIGLDGSIGGEWGGKWYCGVWGWAGEAQRNYVFRGPPEAFDAALKMTGDQKYADTMRKQLDNMFAAKKVVDGKTFVPYLYDEKGWDGYAQLAFGTHQVQGTNTSGTQGNLVNIIVDLYMWSMLPADLERIPILKDDLSAQLIGEDTPPGTEWINYIKGNDPAYPERALQNALKEARESVIPPTAPARAGGAGGGGARAGGAGGVGGGRGAGTAAAPAQIDPNKPGLGGCVSTPPKNLAAPFMAIAHPAAAPAGRGGQAAAGPAGRGMPMPTAPAAAAAARGTGPAPAPGEPVIPTDEVHGSSMSRPPGYSATLGAVPITAMVNLTMGGPDPGGESHGPLPLDVQVRHFNPENKRAGLPEDVGALVNHFDADSVTLTLVNTNPLHERTVTVQMGAYGENSATSVTVAGQTTPVNAPFFSVRLAAGSGETLTIGVRRYANAPTLAFPWDSAR